MLPSVSPALQINMAITHIGASVKGSDSAIEESYEGIHSIVRLV
jgi:hypothetical protein